MDLLPVVMLKVTVGLRLVRKVGILELYVDFITYIVVVHPYTLRNL